MGKTKKVKKTAFRSPCGELTNWQSFGTSKACCTLVLYPSPASQQGTSQGNHHDGLLQTTVIKGKLLLPPGTQAALRKVSLSYSGSCGQAYTSQAPICHPWDRAWQQDGGPQNNQSPREPWNQQTKPSYQFVRVDKVIPRASHLVLHSLVFLNTLVVTAKNTQLAYLSLDRVM